MSNSTQGHELTKDERQALCEYLDRVEEEIALLDRWQELQTKVSYLRAEFRRDLARMLNLECKELDALVNSIKDRLPSEEKKLSYTNG